jgi:hypothetical protein
MAFWSPDTDDQAYSVFIAVIQNPMREGIIKPIALPRPGTQFFPIETEPLAFIACNLDNELLIESSMPARIGVWIYLLASRHPSNKHTTQSLSIKLVTKRDRKYLGLSDLVRDRIPNGVMLGVERRPISSVPLQRIIPHPNVIHLPMRRFGEVGPIGDAIPNLGVKSELSTKGLYVKGEISHAKMLHDRISV